MGFNYTPTRDFLTEVRLGRIDGYSIEARRGWNPDSDSVAFEEVRYLGGLRAPLTTPALMDAASSSAADIDLTGSNAWKIEIFGVDGAYNPISEVISMNGTSASAPTAQSFLSVNKVIAVENGSFNVRNAGDINIRTASGTSGLVQILMPQDTGLSKDSHYTIPTGKTGYLVSLTLEANIRAQREVAFRLMARRNIIGGGGPPYAASAEIFVWSAISGINPLPIHAGPGFEEFTDIWFECQPENNNTVAGVSYEVLLIDNY